MRGKAVVFALALGLILAPPASAKRKALKVVTGTHTITVTGPLTGPLTGTANCPPKTRVLGGGYAALPSAGMTRYVPLESARLGGRAWRARGFAVTDASTPLTLTTEAYCAKLRGKVKTAIGSAQLGAATLSGADATAACPRKTRLLSGGFAVTGADATGLATAFAYENARDATNSNAWSVRTLRGPSGGVAQVDALAYCLKRKKPKRGKGKRAASPRPLSELSGQAVLPSFAGGLTTAATPPCGGRRRGLSGGFGSSTPSDALGGARFYEARYVNGNWVASAFQFVNASPGGLVTAFAYCG